MAKQQTKFKRYHGGYSGMFDKVEIRWHTHWENRDGFWVDIWKPLRVNKYFHDFAQGYSDANKCYEKLEINKKEEIKKLINTICSDRTFKGKLRYLILERDKYTCQKCGIHKNNLQKNNYLEVDHIIEWEDGGKTEYHNGQTLCSSCNIGKHYAKKHNNKLGTLLEDLKKINNIIDIKKEADKWQKKKNHIML